MKKIINAVELVEDQMIAGMCKAFPQYVTKLDCGNVVVRTNKKEGKVALISGGGSGHEPAHGGFVGTGMLDAAVAGAVFTSPTPDQIYEGIKAIGFIQLYKQPGIFTGCSNGNNRVFGNAGAGQHGIAVRARILIVIVRVCFRQLNADERTGEHVGNRRSLVNQPRQRTARSTAHDHDTCTNQCHKAQ